MQLKYDHQFQSAGYYVAEWKGFYKEAGLDVEIRSGMKPNGNSIDATGELANGNAEFCVAGSSALIVRSRGVSIVLLASILQESAVEILARPEVKLLSPSDLPNLRVQGGIYHHLDSELTAMLVSEGIDPANVKIIGLQEPRSFYLNFDRLLNRKVDATVVSSLSVLWLAREKGVAFTRMRPSSYKVDFYGDSLFTHQTVIDKDPEMVEKFQEASIRGWQYALENPKEISKMIAEKLPRVIKVTDPIEYNEFVAARVNELSLYPIVEIGMVNARRWQLMNDSLKRANLIDKDLDLNSFIFTPKQDRAATIQRRYTIAFATLVGLALIFTIFMIRSRLVRRRERNEGVRQLLKSENRLRAIVDTEPECVKVISPDLQLLEMNAAGLEMLEVDSIEDVREYGLVNFISPEYRDSFAAIHKDVIEGNRCTMEFEITGKRGTRLTLEMHAAPLIGDSDEINFLAVTRDITEQKRANELLKKKNQELLQMQKMEAIGRLAGGIAHDFNNLLTAINGYSDLSLRKLSKGDPIRHNIEEIRKAGDRAADLTKQLLAFSRKQIMKPKTFNLNQTVSEIKTMLARLIGENIEIVTRLSSDLGQVTADPGHIEQMLVNLAVNARDAMPDGGKLTIETSNVSLENEYAKRRFPIAPGPYIMLAVTDTGIGIDKETLENIFEPFFTTKEIGAGTGLGLSTVHGIVKQSGGDIWVYSEIGKGTTFKIYLPRVFVESDEFDSDSVDEIHPQATGTILLVEDDDLVANITYAILVGQGYQVLKAANGEEAISICRLYDGKIDLLLTDVVMPRMSGMEVSEHIQDLIPDIKVLFISGYTENAVVLHKLTEAGISFLEKPYTPNVLLQKVRSVIEADHDQ